MSWTTCGCGRAVESNEGECEECKNMCEECQNLQERIGDLEDLLKDCFGLMSIPSIMSAVAHYKDPFSNGLPHMERPKEWALLLMRMGAEIRLGTIDSIRLELCKQLAGIGDNDV